MPTAIVISQGDEITSGEIIDENGPWLTRELTSIGVNTLEIRSVPDNLDCLIAAFRECAKNVDLLFVTGGLGPTDDDLTVEAAAAAFGRPTELSIEAKKQIENHYRNRNRKWTRHAEKMAVVPLNSTIIPNKTGSAPGFAIDGKTFRAFFFPGVPSEMQPMAKEVISSLSSINQAYQHRFYTMGIGESTIAKKLQPLVKNGLKIGYRATRRGNTVKLHAPTAEQIIDTRHLLNTFIYSETDANLAKVIVDALQENNQTIATAESCTGGLIASWLVDVPGASSVLEQGLVVYSNASKVRLCHVDEHLIESNGAVSQSVAIALAEGVMLSAQSNWGIGVTGVAGPGGGSNEKPVGTVHIAVANRESTIHQKLNLKGTRSQIRESAAAMALFFLLNVVKKTKKS